MNPLDYYSSRTVTGLQIILENGYPCSTGGFSAAQARYATANAIRFWLSEEGADSQWNFTNRAERPNAIRAKSGYQSLLNWSDHLLQLARNQQLIAHSVMFFPLVKGAQNLRRLFCRNNESSPYELLGRIYH